MAVSPTRMACDIRFCCRAKVPKLVRACRENDEKEKGDEKSRWERRGRGEERNYEEGRGREMRGGEMRGGKRGKSDERRMER